MIETREFSLSKGEYRRFLRRLVIERHASAIALAWFLAATLLIYYGDMSTAAGIKWTLASWAPLLIFLALWTIGIVAYLPIRQSNARTAEAAYRAHRVRFEPDCVHVEVDDGSRLRLAFSAVERIDLDEEFLLIRQDSGLVNAVPRRAFADPAAANAAVDLFRTAGAGATVTGPGQAANYTGVAGQLRGVWHNLKGGLRLLLFRRVTRDAFAVSADQIILLSLLAVTVAIGGEYLGTEGTVTFNSYGLLSDATARLLLLAALYLIARLLGRTKDFLLFAVIVLGIDPWVTGIQSVAETVETTTLGTLLSAATIQLLAFCWYVIAWVRGARVAFAGHRGSVPVSLLVLFLAVVAPVSALPINTFWYAEYDDADLLPDINVEEVFYRQPGMIAATVDDLEPQRPGVIDLYHIGFGSVAYQRVFEREITHVRDLLAQRFDTAGRAISLVNHGDSVQQMPIASASNLALALQHMARKMDPDEDVLLLYLTSHGSRDGQLAVDFWPLQLNPLSAQGLRRMLDESGIRRRVIVVSACYSGSFIDALADDNTLIVTASARDRNSFGCSNENEFTYFGEAYFKRALQQTHSFIDGYALARQIVMEREKAENLQPSNPRIHVGSRVSEFLQPLERRLNSLHQDHASVSRRDVPASSRAGDG